MSTRGRQRLAEHALYLGIALLLITPVTFHLTGEIVGEGDAEAWLWICWRAGRLISAGQLLPAHIPDAIWPYGSNLLAGDGYLPTLVGGWWNVLLPPILAFNAAVITALLLNLWSARHLALQLTSSRAVAAVCAVAFASAPALSIRLDGHYNLLFAFPAALLVADAVSAVRDHRVRWLRLALLLFVAYLSSIYYLLFGGIAFAVIVLASHLSARMKVRAAGRMAAAALVCAVLMTPFLAARLSLDRAEAAAARPVTSGAEATVMYSADATSLISVPDQSVVPAPGFGAIRDDPNPLEATSFPGLLLLLGGGAIIALRHRMRRALVSASAVLYVLSLGPALHLDGWSPRAPDGTPLVYLPFQLLLEVPGLEALRAPNRATFVLVALLTAGLAVGLGRVWPQLGRSGRRLCVTVCALLLVVNVMPKAAADLGVTPATETALKTIAADPDGADAVVVAPADCTVRNTAAAKLQILHLHPMVGCQADAAAIPFASGIPLYLSSAGLASLRCDPGHVGPVATGFATRPSFDAAAVTELHRDLGVRYLIVDRTAVSASCPGLAADIGALEPGVHVLGRDGSWVIIDLQPLESSS